MENKCFKIINKDGLFSSGGSCPSWSKKGKSWSSLGHVRSHLANLYRNDVYGPDAQILEYVFVPATSPCLNVQSEIKEQKLRKQKKQEEWRKSIEDFNTEKERKEFERLKLKFEGEQND